MKYTYLLLLFVFLGCKEDAKKLEELSDTQKSQLETFSKFFEQKIKDKDYDIFNVYWSDQELIKRIGPLGKTGKTVFDHYFKNEWASDVKMSNLNLINNIKYDLGTIELTKLESFPNHVEATYTIGIGASNIEFVRYRFELRNTEPVITDRCNIKDKVWISERIRQTIQTGVKYPITTKQRQVAGINFRKAEDCIDRLDYANAIEYLNSIPEDFSKNLNVSILKLESAFEIDAETYSKTLADELENNDYEYINYINELFMGDSISYKKYFTHLVEEVGESDMIDSLYNMSYVW